MSTRWYPIYQRGNPQLRIYLPNFWLKLVKSENQSPRQNIVQFHCSMEMTKHDIQSYLEKIYKVPVIKVNTRIALGQFKRNELGTIIKEDDVKVAYVYLPRYEKFEFPDMFNSEKKKEDKEKEENTHKEAKESFFNEMKKNNEKTPTLPNWFTI